MLGFSRLLGPIDRYREGSVSITSTYERIIEVAQELIQTRGYNAISFNDIAVLVGIKKPSIVHHFPSKAVLGEAVVTRYHQRFANALQEFANAPDKTAMDAFEFYCSPYLDFGDADKVCLCGALAGEFKALPDNVQLGVRRFFEDQLICLEVILRRGQRSGEFHFNRKPKILAQLILDSLQGALTIKRCTGDKQRIQRTVSLLKAELFASDSSLR